MVVRSRCLQVDDAFLGQPLAQVAVLELLDENPHVFPESFLVLQFFARDVLLQFSLLHLAQGLAG